MTVIVLFGGASDERFVSVATAQNVVRTLGNPLCWFCASSGAVYDVSPAELLGHQRPFETEFNPTRPAIWPDLEQALDTIPVDDPAFFLGFHGGAGEDGTVQRMLEMRGLPFTGSGSAASAAAFDKGRAKEMIEGKVKTAESRIIGVSDQKTFRTAAEEMLERHERIVLKPLAAGSSRGLFFVGRGDPVDEIAARVTKLEMPYIIEQFIRGRELTVGVAELGDGLRALPVIEIEVDPGFAFDYEGKYLGKGTREICPARISEAMAAAAKQTALAAHTGLGCDGYSRTDMMAAEDGMYFLELNTLPGLTTSSLVPQELRVENIEFRDFLDTQIELGKRRSGRRPARPAIDATHPERRA